ncbi:MAG: sugar ABC transporter permease [Clostridiales bacterium]|nr:sugar ABC transporter permease [Clostridiales bacterium]
MIQKKRQKVKEHYSRKENIAGFLFILPAMIPLLIFWIIPVVWSGGLSFTDWDMMSENINFMGIKNYISLLKDPNFGKILWNTLVFAVGSTVPSIILGLLVALAMNGARKGTGIYRTVIFAPYITPMVAVSVVWSWIFEPRVGILNFFLEFLGLPGSEWTKSSSTAMLSVLIVTVWKSIGWTMIFYMEAIRKVPQSLLEAASIDGANGFWRFWKITLPMISPTTFFLVIMSTISSLQAYDQIQVLTQGGPAGATRTLLYYYYQEAFRNFNTGKASSVAIVLVIITVVLSLVETEVSKKTVFYN